MNTEVDLARCAAAAVAIALCLGASSCKPGHGGWRVYTEVDEGAVPHSHEHAAAPAAAPARPAALAWNAPAGWTAEGASGMRLEAFRVRADGAEGLCTLVMLGGAAGGLEPNVRRWIGQLGVAAPEGGAFEAFLAGQERFASKGGYDVVAVDLTSLPGASADEEESMLAALANVDGATLFVKMTGPAALLRREKANFRELCTSIQKP